MCVCVCGGRVGCLCLTAVIIGVFSCALGRFGSVSLQKSVSFSGARTQPSSESHGVDTALMYASPSPQLIKKESSFDLSGG